MPQHPKSDLICVTSAPPAWDELMQYTAETHAAYCKARGYDYDCAREDLYDQRQGEARIGIRGFHKFNRILHFMPMYKYVVWLDADMVITNHSLDLRQLSNEKVYLGVGPDIIVCYDWNGFNSTVQIVRSCPTTQAFYWACNNTGREFFLYHGWHEMEAMRYFSSKPPYNKMVGCESIKKLCAILPDEYEPAGVPRPIMEPYAWEPGDFAVHLSALSIERRVELARQYAEITLAAR